MVKTNVLNIIETKGLTLQWLSMEARIPYSTLHKLANNKTTSISFDILDRITTALQCDISDILIKSK